MSIAVARDGRIALSGLGFGVVVLDTRGRLIFQLDVRGLAAFDSRGDIVVAGGFAGDGRLEIAPGIFLQGSATFFSMFIATYDVDGNYVSHIQIDRGSPAGLAIDASDHIALSGIFVEEM